MIPADANPLTGQFDVSIALHDVTKYASSENPAEWLIVTGLPRHLRPDGWVYVRTEAAIVGRVAASGLGHLEIRQERTGSPPGVRGPGPVVFVQPDTWDTSFRFDLSAERRCYGRGTRYIRTHDDGTIQHWSVTEEQYYGPRFGRFTPEPAEASSRENLHDTTGDEAGADGWVVEGAVKLTQVVSYERDRKARKRCIAAHGLDCAVCGLNFEQRYGELGREFIHVHHRRPISDVGHEYVLDPVQDLVPLCPNCHAMVHRQTPALTVEQLRDLLR